MQHRFPVFQCKPYGGIETVLDGLNRGMFLNHPIRILVNNRFYQLGNILKIIIKGVTVNTTGIHDIPDSDLA